MEKSDIVIIWDPQIVTPDMYRDLVVALGDLVRAVGGLGVERVQSFSILVKEKETQ